ncbi:hypothetical protein [Streptomyces actinomycinicus]|uniref:hypothetical protein n=1 Tax=Streptomyces actinomycinicus TaxID=1695166 RepID=UPI0027DA6736|nr:hypothetical protein [Streptomyces actinomycinicus]
MRRIKRAGLVVVGAALMAAASGCHGDAPCAGYGVVSGVGVLFDHRGYGDLTGGSYQLCARGECVKGALRRERITNVRLSLPRDVDPGSGPIRFRVTRKGEGKAVIDTSVDARLIHQTDGCGSNAYSRGLAFTKATGLTTKIPKSLSDAWMKQIRSLATASPDPSTPS